LVNCHTKRSEGDKKTGFTLAEVLITLGIVGVVAALTMPNLISKYQEKVAINRLKQNYSMLSQAVKQAIEKNGSVDTWCDMSTDTYASCSEKIYNILQQHLYVQKQCQGNNISNKDACFASKYKLENGNTQNWNVAKLSFVLTNGAAISIDSWVESYFWCTANTNRTGYTGQGGAPHDSGWVDYYCNCGTIHLDIDGVKGTNTNGKDLFAFQLYKDGIVPLGRENTIHFFAFENCLSGNGIGTCTAWALYNDNMDYLHCNDLSWDGKHKCKN